MLKQLKKISILTCLLSVSLLTMNAQKTEAANTISGKGSIKFKESDWITNPLDPEEHNKEVDPGGKIPDMKGPLRLDFVSEISFGAQAISEKDQTYYANAQLFNCDTPARGNYIQVTDNRGTMKGWQLSVRQETQFKNDNTKNKELKGAILSFDNQWVNSLYGKEYHPTILKDTIKIDQIGTTYPIAIAEKGKGLGTCTIEFGSSGSIDGIENTLIEMKNADGNSLKDPNIKDKPMYENKAITLFVPGKTLKDPVKYRAVLTWTISELS